mmetsp:Transcript_1489/g.4251  ORF Transcript_1489/g.4251 Transcript_1489/m.4251 type:complete len:214 (-) Transcript_1489:360-1001(-)
MGGRHDQRPIPKGQGQGRCPPARGRRRRNVAFHWRHSRGLSCAGAMRAEDARAHAGRDRLWTTEGIQVQKVLAADFLDHALATTMWNQAGDHDEVAEKDVVIFGAAQCVQVSLQLLRLQVGVLICLAHEARSWELVCSRAKPSIILETCDHVGRVYPDHVPVRSRLFCDLWGRSDIWCLKAENKHNAHARVHVGQLLVRLADTLPTYRGQATR